MRLRMSIPSAHDLTESSQRIDDWTADQLGSQLTRGAALVSQGLLRRREIPRRISPALAYGRHRGPASHDARVAAVMVAVLRRNDRWWIPLTLRPSHLSHHGGQICLPGGRLEPGENAADAAQREFTEELGVDCEIRRPCGMLSEQFVFASNNRVQPIVAILEDSKYKWNPDPAEVSQVIEMPLAGLLDPKNRTTMFREKPVRKDDMTVDRISFRAPAFWTGAAVRHWTSDVGGAESSIAPITSLSSRLIWGATAIMLDEMVQMLQ